MSLASLFVVALEFDGGAAVVAGAVCLESARARVTAAGAAAQLLRSASARLCNVTSSCLRHANVRCQKMYM